MWLILCGCNVLTCAQVEDLIFTENLTDSIATITANLVNTRSIAAPGQNVEYIDVARGVINAVPHRWIARVPTIYSEQTASQMG